MRREIMSGHTYRTAKYFFLIFCLQQVAARSSAAGSLKVFNTRGLKKGLHGPAFCRERTNYIEQNAASLDEIVFTTCITRVAG